MQSFLETIVRLSLRFKRSAIHAPCDPVAGPPELAVGDRWGQFEILGTLGRGAFGLVYRARDTLGRDVALKLLASPEAVREGKLLAMLKHPQIVGVHTYEQTPECAGLAMELVAGENLEQFVSRVGKLDPRYAGLIGRDLCRGLALVHRKSLVHRDIKAKNVMRQPDGSVVLVDFGLGQQVDPGRQSDEIAGTMPYMAPELFEGSSASIGTDLYATGVLLFYLVSLELPVSGETYVEFKEAHRVGRRKHLLDIRPDLPSSFVAIVEKAIDADVANRFRSAGAMAAALEQVLQTRPRRKIPWVPIGIAAGLILGGLTAWVYWPESLSTAPELHFVRIGREDALTQDPTLSSDGTLVAFASDQADEGNLDIWVRQVPDGASMRLTKNPSDDSTPAFSPDGHWIAFRSEREGGGIYLVSAFGGEERLLARGAHAPRFSPDGKYIAYFVGEPWHPRLPAAKIYIIPANGGTPRQLCASMADARNPVWAPDSQRILFQGSRQSDIPPDEDAEWWLTRLDGSPPVNTGALDRFQKQGLEVHTLSAFWSKDRLVFSAAREANVNLWRARISLGILGGLRQAERLTSGAGFETSPWTTDRGQLAFSNQQGKLRIWSFATQEGSLRAGNQANRVTNTTELDAFPTVSKDVGILSFTRTSSETGVRQIWIRDLKTGVEKMLTNTPQAKSNPMISPDGKRIAFTVKEDHRDSIYMVDSASQALARACERCGVVTAWSPSSDSLLVSGNRIIQELDPRSGTLHELMAKAGNELDEAEWSPDKRWIAFSATHSGLDRQVFLAPSAKGGEWKPIGEPGMWSDKPHWSTDGSAVYFYSGLDGFPCIWMRSVNPDSGEFIGSPKPVHHFHNTRLSPVPISQPVRGFAVTADKIFCNLAEVTSSVWMSTNSKK